MSEKNSAPPPLAMLLTETMVQQFASIIQVYIRQLAYQWEGALLDSILRNKGFVAIQKNSKNFNSTIKACSLDFVPRHSVNVSRFIAVLDHLAEVKADEVVPFVFGILMTIALIVYVKKEFSRKFTALPVITSQLFGLAFFKSKSQFQDEFEFGEHQRWQYIWALQFFAILVVVLVWVVLYGVFAVSPYRKTLYEEFDKCCSCTWPFVLSAGIALLIFLGGCLELFVMKKPVTFKLVLYFSPLIDVFLCIMVIYTSRYRLLCDFFLHMLYLAPTSCALYYFPMFISPTYVNAIRDIVAFSFLAFSVVKCFSSCFPTNNQK